MKSANRQQERNPKIAESGPEITAPTLLPAKFSVPVLHAKGIHRTELLGRFDQAVEDEVALILISAPAGYGKTVAISRWVHDRDRRTSWLTIDRLDNDPKRFFSYVLAMLQPAASGVLDSLSATLSAPQLPSPEVVASLVSASVTLSAQPAVIVLDDYHLIENPFIHEVFQSLLNLPVPGLVLVLATREDPPFFLSRLRTQGRVLEIRIRELTLSRDETEMFLTSAMGIDLPDAIVDSMILKTEGWIAGLQLFGLTLRSVDPDRIEQSVEEFGASTRYIADYLFEEVMHHLSEEVAEFLYDTAVLDRLNEDLCNEVTGRTNAGAMLRDIEESNLFPIAMDAQREWYRYHHLFSSFLRAQSPEARQLRAANRASAWFYTRGFKAEAIQYAMRSDDRALAERMITNEVPQAFAQGNHQLLTSWLDSLSGAYIRSNFALGVYQAWVLFFAGKLDDLLALIEGLDTAAPKHVGTVSYGRYQSLKSWLAESRSAIVPAPLDHSSDDPDEDPFFQILSLQASGLLAYRQGSTAESVSQLRSAYDIGSTIGNPFISLCVLHRLAFYLIEGGRRAEAEGICRDALSGFADRLEEPLPITGLARIALAATLYEQNNLVEAAGLADSGLGLVSQLRLGDVLVEDGIRIAVLVHLALGDNDRADLLIEEAEKDAVAADRPHSIRRFGAISAELALRREAVTAAEAWAHDSHHTLETLLQTPPDFEHAAFAQLLLATRQFADARELLQMMLSWHESAGRLRSTISTRMLLARAVSGMGQDADARQHVREAVSLAEPQHYLRAVLDFCGDDPLVRETSLASSPFVESLIAAASSATHGRLEPGVLPPQTTPLGSLSRRETEILGLVSRGLSNMEISEELFISVGTVKWHVSNILRQLAVSSRAKAAGIYRDSMES